MTRIEEIKEWASTRAKQWHVINNQNKYDGPPPPNCYGVGYFNTFGEFTPVADNGLHGFDAQDIVKANGYVPYLLELVENGSDGYHTFSELYQRQALYHAHACRAWLKEGYEVTKSLRHHDGESCFQGGWFIVTAQLPTGQVSNHYRLENWDLFDVPEVKRAPEWDGHTPQEAARRLEQMLTYDLSQEKGATK